MLNYQSLSHHDAVYARECLHRRPAPEFEAWLLETGIVDGNGRLAADPALIPPALRDATRMIGLAA